jgi:hypothetical protein
MRHRIDFEFVLDGGAKPKCARTLAFDTLLEGSVAHFFQKDFGGMARHINKRRLVRFDAFNGLMDLLEAMSTLRRNDFNADQRILSVFEVFGDFHTEFEGANIRKVGEFDSSTV